jgi:hypothetical protein
MHTQQFLISVWWYASAGSGSLTNYSFKAVAIRLHWSFLENCWDSDKLPIGVQFSALIVPYILYTVKKILDNFQKCSSYKGINRGKLKICKMAIFKLTFSMKIIDFPTYFYWILLRCWLFWHKNINIRKKLFWIFLTVHFSVFVSFCHKFCSISAQEHNT